MNVFVSTIPCTYMEMVKYTKYCLGGFSAKYFAIFQQTLHVLLRRSRKVPGHSVNLTILKIYSVFRTFRILFPGEISLDAFLSRIPLETAICPNNRHVSSRRSHERTRAAS